MKKAKDDFCFPFYLQRYLGGTMGFSLEMHGAYLLAMIYQFQNGHFTEEEINRVVNDEFGCIKFKYTLDDNGKYYNEGMETVIIERKKFIETKRNNRLGKTKVPLENNGSSSTVPLQGDGSGNGNIVVVKDIEKIVTLLDAEIPDLKLGNFTISPVVFETINNLALDFPELIEFCGWEIYVEKLKVSDWIMDRMVGKMARTLPISLEYICKKETYMKAMTGGFKNKKVKKDPNAFI